MCSAKFVCLQSIVSGENTVRSARQAFVIRDPTKTKAICNITVRCAERTLFASCKRRFSASLNRHEPHATGRVVIRVCALQFWEHAEQRAFGDAEPTRDGGDVGIARH